jgi:hypothetical protein
VPWALGAMSWMREADGVRASTVEEHGSGSESEQAISSTNTIRLKSFNVITGIPSRSKNR